MQDIVTPQSHIQTRKSEKPESKKKSIWWAWSCLGCIVIFIILVVIMVLVGLRLYGEIEKSFQHYDEGRENIDESQVGRDDLLKNSYSIIGGQEYLVEETIKLVNQGKGPASSVDLRMALIQDIVPYQEVIEKKLFAPNDPTLIADKYDNSYANFKFGEIKVGEDITIKATYKVKANEVVYNLSPCDGNTVQSYLYSEDYIEANNPRLGNVASQVTNGANNKCEETKNIYNFVGDSLTYERYVPEDRGALSALDTKSGDCTEFSDLFIALSRASEIPARFVEGITYMEGATKLAETKHDWVEINMPGVGWVTMDPTWGRYPEYRDKYYAHATGDHVIVTRGRNLNVLDNRHYFAYDFYWSGEEADVIYEESWKIERVE